jgi:antirestriction protein ArdC
VARAGAAEIILANGGAVIVRFGDETAFHSPTTDRVQIPPLADFNTVQDIATFYLMMRHARLVTIRG